MSRILRGVYVGALISLTLAFIQVESAPPAGAATVAGFEIDGNLVSNGEEDWASLTGQPVSLDRVSSALDNGFKSGNSAKELNPDGWDTVIGQVNPAANDIGDIYLTARMRANRQYALFGFERATDGGSTAYNVELNLRPNKTNANGVSVPDRRVGDLLIDVVQQGGGALSIGGVYSWNGSNWAVFVAGPGAVVTANNTVPVVDTDGNTLPVGTFAEVGVDLTSVYSATSACPGVDFAVANIRSRASSASITSDLKDYVAPAPIDVPTGCGQLRIEKKNASGALLPGAAFQVSPNPVPGGTGSSLTVTDGGADDPDGSANGIVAFPKALSATYTVVETAPPAGYILASGPQSATVTSGNLSTVGFTNSLGTASWRKVDEVTGSPVLGATFTLTATGGAALTRQPTPRTIVDNGANDADPAAGVLKATGLFTGTYSLAETVAPAGYDLPTVGNPKTFTISSAAPDATLAAAYQDPRKPARIVVNKTDAVTGAAVDASFQLWRDNGDGVFSAASDTAVGSPTSTVSGTLTFANLGWGDYWVQEVAAPTGYLVAPGSPFAVTLGSANISVTVAVADPQVRSTLSVSKTDANTSAPLEGGRFTLFRDSDGTAGPSAGDSTAGTCSTDALGRCSVGNLVFGTYYWQETSPPTGYVLPTHVYSTPVIVNAANAGTTFPPSPFADVRISSGMTIDKQAGPVVDEDGNGPDVGDTILYSFVVTNTGNVTLSSVGVSDPKVGPVTCPATSLAPGASMTCRKRYVLTQDDVDAGVVDNRATVSGTPPTGDAVEASGSTSTSIVRSASLTMDKQAGPVVDGDGNGPDVGDTIAYSFEVENTGNVTLTDLVVDDPLVGVVDCPVTTLLPGESTTCTKTYTITQADVDAGHVANGAAVSATPPAGVTPPSAEDSTDTIINRISAMVLDKEAGSITDLDDNGHDVGDTIVYTFVVENTGNVTLAGISVSDPKVGPVTCPVTVLAPGDDMTCSKTYVLTQADVNAGVVNNRATVSGTPPTGPPPTSATDSTSTAVSRTALLVVDKQAGPLVDVDENGPDVGDTIAYSFVVENTGNVTLTNLAVDDSLVGVVDCPFTTLLPGQFTTCTASYVLTQADVDAGHVANAATASATPPTGMTPPSAEDSTDTDIAAGPGITVDKQAGTPTGNLAGDTILYSFVVTNTGNVTLSSVGVSDPKVGPVTCPATSLAPGASMTCRKRYVLTQDDVDAGVVDNRATVSGTPPTGDAVEASGSTSTSIVRSASLTMDKQAGPVVDGDGNGPDVGDTIAYSFEVENTGNVTLTDLVVDDPLVGVVDCPVTTLLPGESTTCTKTYTITQADVDAGHVANGAAVSATPPAGVTPPSAEDSTDSPIKAGPAVSVDKQAGPLVDGDGNGPDVGDTIVYTFVVENTGNVTLAGISVSDPKVGPVTCPVTVLAPGDDMTCSKTYVLTQADVNAGVVNNRATVSGTPPTGPPPTSATDSTSTAVSRTASLVVDKQAGPLVDVDENGPDVGDTIAYSFVVENTGNVTLTNLAVDDSLVGVVDCPFTTLLPGQFTTCTASYVLTQADVDAGHVANAATASATPPTGMTPPSAEDSTDTDIAAGPGITVDKQAGTPTGNLAGDTILYSFVVTNTGNVTLSSVGVSDPKVGPVTCPATSLAPGASMTCRKRYVLTQDDVDAGVVDNRATVSGTPPTGDAVEASGSTSTSIVRSASLTMDKQAGPVVDGDGNGPDVGDTIAYSFEVENTGNVTLTDLVVDDPLVGVVDCPVTTLLPGESTTCTKTYTITQADVDAGHVANGAAVSATPPAGVTPPSAEDSTDTIINRISAMVLDKEAGSITDLDDNGHDVGDTIVYTFVVENTGNVTLAGISVSDPKVGPVTCPVTVLAPGDDMTCSKTYVLTQADVNAGVVNNRATVSGTPPTGPPPTSATDSTSTAVSRTASLVVDKQAGPLVDVDENGPDVGDTIAYSFVVENTGNVTLTNLAVDDSLVGVVDCPFTTLLPGQFTTCTASYVLTQADVDAGHVANAATASATPPTGMTPPSAEDSTDTDIAAGPGITVDKQAGTPTGNLAGDTILYSFVVTNTGNVTLDPVLVDDPLVGVVDCPVTLLPPGESMTCTASYELTQADVDTGLVANSATVSGIDPSDTEVSHSDMVSTSIPAEPSVSVDKRAGVPSGTSEDDTIDYEFLVTNNGNVTLDPVVVDDPTVDPVDCPDTVLAPGDEMTCTASYALTQADVDAGHVANRATVTGTDPNGTDVTAVDSTDVTIPAGPAISLMKSGTLNGSDVGHTIDYSFVVTNTGNVTLDPVGVDDPTVDLVECPVTVLAPDESMTCSASYTLTQADVDSGVIDNTATATGIGPGDVEASDEDSVSTPVPAGPAISMDKQAGVPSGNAEGDTIDYAFVVTNIGNVTLDPVVVDDPIANPVDCPVTVLAPDESMTCSATYTLTQADVDAGQVDNSATVTGTDPNGTDVTAVDTVSTSVDQAPSVGLEKSADTAGPVGLGDQITYSFLVTNTGNVTLTNVRVSDPMLGAVTCAVTVLAPGESTTCTAPPYTVTAGDASSGSIVNAATALGDGGGGAEVRSNDELSIRARAPEPGIELEKRADTAGPVDVGDELAYTFTVTNTGNVTLRNVVVRDRKVGPVTCDTTRLAPGDSTTCTSSPYRVTADDVREGSVVNHATVSASACDRGSASDCTRFTDADSLTVPTARSGALPATGSPVSPAAPLAALAMLAAGWGLLMAGRRKRTDPGP